MSPKPTDPMYALMQTMGEIASDVKHIMAAQSQQNKSMDDLETRMRAVEQFRWKLVGIATAIPVFIASAGLALRGILS